MRAEAPARGIPSLTFSHLHPSHEKERSLPPPAARVSRGARTCSNGAAPRAQPLRMLKASSPAEPAVCSPCTPCSDAEPCTELFCPAYSLALAPDPLLASAAAVQGTAPPPQVGACAAVEILQHLLRGNSCACGAAAACAWGWPPRCAPSWAQRGLPACRPEPGTCCALLAPASPAARAPAFMPACPVCPGPVHRKPTAQSMHHNYNQLITIFRSN